MFYIEKNFRKLWVLMYDRCTNHWGLDNKFYNDEYVITLDELSDLY